MSTTSALTAPVTHRPWCTRHLSPITDSIEQDDPGRCSHQFGDGLRLEDEPERDAVTIRRGDVAFDWAEEPHLQDVLGAGRQAHPDVHVPHTAAGGAVLVSLGLDGEPWGSVVTQTGKPWGPLVTQFAQSSATLRLVERAGDRLRALAEELREGDCPDSRPEELRLQDVIQSGRQAHPDAYVPYTAAGGAVLVSLDIDGDPWCRVVTQIPRDTVALDLVERASARLRVLAEALRRTEAAS